MQAILKMRGGDINDITGSAKQIADEIFRDLDWDG